MEATSAVHSFGTRRLRSLPPELVPAQRGAEPRVRRLVLFVKSSCSERGKVALILVLRAGL